MSWESGLVIKFSNQTNHRADTIPIRSVNWQPTTFNTQQMAQSQETRMNLGIGIIIQARSGSTRMPRKVLQKFSNNKSLLETVVDRVKQNSFNLPVVVATTTSSSDNAITHVDLGSEVQFYRGSEENVLSRFADCCLSYGFDRCIRVCSDNPFIDPELIDRLVETSNANPEVDYISYSVNGTPGIKLHTGIFTELISLKALRTVQESTEDSYYLEHVTNYVYETTPQNLLLKFIPMDSLSEYSSLRLTIDTLQDFETCDEIIKQFTDNELDFSLPNIHKFISAHHKGLAAMKNQIELNKK